MCAGCFCSGCEGGDFAGSEREQLQRHVRGAVLQLRPDPAQPGFRDRLQTKTGRSALLRPAGPSVTHRSRHEDQIHFPSSEGFPRRGTQRTNGKKVRNVRTFKQTAL